MIRIKTKSFKSNTLLFLVLINKKYYDGTVRTHELMEYRFKVEFSNPVDYMKIQLNEYVNNIKTDKKIILKFLYVKKFPKNLHTQDLSMAA